MVCKGAVKIFRKSQWYRNILFSLIIKSNFEVFHFFVAAAILKLIQLSAFFSTCNGFICFKCEPIKEDVSLRSESDIDEF